MSVTYSPQIIRSQRYASGIDEFHNGPYELGSFATHEDPSLRNPMPPTTPAGSEGRNYGALLQLVNTEDHLGYFSTSALILNKMVGTGIFVNSITVLAITQSKGVSLFMWLLGGVMTWAGLIVYLEYGIRFPLTGGELHYVDYVWTRPKKLFTYMYSIMFIILSGSQGNALIFGQAVLVASTPAGTPIDPRLQKLIAILIVTFVCQFQAYSRISYVLFNNIFAAYKILLLSFITITGLCAFGNLQAASAAATNAPYGPENFSGAFDGASHQVYGYGLTMLLVLRAFLGYENANFVLEEVRRPPGDESRVFRRAAKLTVLLVSFFYIMANVAFFVTCTTDELTKSSDLLSLFFTKVFGPSPNSRTASGTLLALSTVGNIMSYTFANVRVKQEIARLGIIPYPEFWAKSTANGAPGPALLLYWIFSVLFILATPLSSADGYLVISTMFAYSRTWVGIILGLALLAAPYLKSFSSDGRPWKPQSSRLFGLWLLYPLVIIYIIANFFVLVVCWFPSDEQATLHTKSYVLPSFVGPLVGTVFFVGGALYWVWDLYILPYLGLRMEVLPEHQADFTVYLTFRRYITGFALQVYNILTPIVIWVIRKIT